MDAGATGWTGYTWNKKLFPNPAAFLTRVTLPKLESFVE
jgi:hypothetical protein